MDISDEDVKVLSQTSEMNDAEFGDPPPNQDSKLPSFDDRTPEQQREDRIREAIEAGKNEKKGKDVDYPDGTMGKRRWWGGSK